MFAGPTAWQWKFRLTMFPSKKLLTFGKSTRGKPLAARCDTNPSLPPGAPGVRPMTKLSAHFTSMLELVPGGIKKPVGSWQTPMSRAGSNWGQSPFGV